MINQTPPLPHKEPPYLADLGYTPYRALSFPKVVVFSGAGLSAESGLGTFRDANDGLWTKHNIAEICNINTFDRNRNKVFDFYDELKSKYSSAQPNAAHRALAKLQDAFPNEVVMVTANVDDLLEKAGCTNVLHVHGHKSTLHCRYCLHYFYIGDESFKVGLNMDCPHCKKAKTLKPGVILFGESVPSYADMFQAFNNQTVNHKLIIGTSLSVINPEMLAINKYDGTHSYYLDQGIEPKAQHLFSECLKGPATETVPALVERLIQNGLD